jgi:hypothetical protein
MTSLTAAVARGRAVEVVTTTTGDADRVSTPAPAHAARGVFATCVEAGRRAIGSPSASPSVCSTTSPGRFRWSSRAPATPGRRPGGHGAQRCHRRRRPGEPPPGRLTVTHPTHWSRGQIDALIDAVRSAARGSGLQLIPNAVAVAVAIGHALGHPLADGAAVAVLDIGAAG